MIAEALAVAVTRIKAFAAHLGIERNAGATYPSLRGRRMPRLGYFASGARRVLIVAIRLRVAGPSPL